MAAIPGTILAAKISPGDTTATFPTHEDIYGKGGLMSVTNFQELSSIPLDRQKVGMVVHVNSESQYYTLSSLSYPLTSYSIFFTKSLFVSGGNSNQWNSTYTTVSSLSTKFIANKGADYDDSQSGGVHGFVNVSGGNAGSSYNGGNAGYIDLRGADSLSDPAGSGGFIQMTGGVNGGRSGNITLRATEDARGGDINLSSGFAGGRGGDITMTGTDGRNAGDINTSAGNFGSGGSITTSGGDNTDGGSINTSGGGEYYPGGSINTSSGGGSIDTRGTGLIEMGVKTTGGDPLINTRTNFRGTATVERNIYLPDESGTIALTGNIIPTVTNYLSTANIVTINNNLTVVGTISTSQHGSSNQWNEAFTMVRNLSGDIVLPRVKPPSPNYITIYCPGAVGTNTGPAARNRRFALIYLPVSDNINTLACRTGVAAPINTNFHIGLWNVGLNGLPSNLITGGTGATGTSPNVTIDVSVSPVYVNSGIYYISFTPENAMVTSSLAAFNPTLDGLYGSVFGKSDLTAGPNTISYIATTYNQTGHEPSFTFSYTFIPNLGIKYVP